MNSTAESGDVPGQIAQMDEIEHVVDFIELVLIVGSSDYRSCRELTIAKVLGKQTVRVLAKPLQRMPVIIGGRRTHAAAVAEVGQADDMSADCRERRPQELASEGLLSSVGVHRVFVAALGCGTRRSSVLGIAGTACRGAPAVKDRRWSAGNTRYCSVPCRRRVATGK